MEMIGESTASYLARTPCVPVFLLILTGLEAKGLLAFQGRRGITSIVRWNLRPVIFGVREEIPEAATASSRSLIREKLASMPGSRKTQHAFGDPLLETSNGLQYITERILGAREGRESGSRFGPHPQHLRSEKIAGRMLLWSSKKGRESGSRFDPHPQHLRSGKLRNESDRIFQK